jgi:hypothetical protein
MADPVSLFGWFCIPDRRMTCPVSAPIDRKLREKKPAKYLAFFGECTIRLSFTAISVQKF